MSDLKPQPDEEAFHRLTSRLATLDLDPATVEILTAVLTIDLTEETPEASPRPAG
jgi:hypothetical protein